MYVYKQRVQKTAKTISAKSTNSQPATRNPQLNLFPRPHRRAFFYKGGQTFGGILGAQYFLQLAN